MSAATVFPEIKDTQLQKLAFAVLTSLRKLGGTAVTGFTDRLGNAVPANSQLSGGQTNTASQAGPGREVEILIQISPDGQSATAKVIAKSPAGVEGVVGTIDSSLLAAFLV